jgi:hypothetical protein
MTEERTIEAEARPEPAPARTKGERSYPLGPDSRGAAINGGLYTLYAVASLYLAVGVAEPNTPWFYVFYFMFFLAVFQGFTVVGRHCLHKTPKSVVRVDVVGKRLRLTRKNGTEVELTRDVDYTRRKSVLVIQGKTHDNQKVSEVIRAGTLDADAFEALVAALKRFR